MSLRAFTGGAGCGKTHRLMDVLVEVLAAQPLAPGRKVLALTFMHGSRRRLDERLSMIPQLRSHFECSTLDAFAGRIVRRWRSLAERLGHAIPDATAYDETCNVAGAVLEIPEAARWFAASYPLVVLDEAQDLHPARLRVMRALEPHVQLLAAADEFQCLIAALRPNPACDWIARFEDVTNLTAPRRTAVGHLLNAAAALRRGESPLSGGPFSIRAAGTPALAGAHVSGEIQWYRQGGTVAIISPTNNRYVTEALTWVETRTTNRGCGPHRLERELSEGDEIAVILARLVLAPSASFPEVIAAISACSAPVIAHGVTASLDILRRARGRNQFGRDEIEEMIRREVAAKRARRTSHSAVRAMTVYGAKNREFDLAIVLWPGNVAGTDDQKRRLLYNAVTRAKRRCLVLVQVAAHLRAAPFA